MFADEITAVDVGRRGKPRLVERDECPRPDSSLAGLAALPGLFGPEGINTAGNSCGLNDAGAATLVTTLAHATSLGVTPRGRLVSWGTVGVEPKRMGLGPVGACRQALESAGLDLSQIDLIELNDSFTAQAIALERALGLDPERVNVNGGAIALGHPMAATGTRLVTAALNELHRRGARYALCTVCVGGGQGIALIVERL